MSLMRNGRQTAEEAREQQQANQEHMQNLQFADDGSLSQGYIDTVTESELEPGTVEILSNLLSKDFVLGNLSEAEVHEHRWLTREESNKVYRVSERREPDADDGGFLNS